MVRHPASFRDPCASVYTSGNEIKRIITRAGKANYEEYVSSGLHRELVARGLALEHQEEPAPARDRERVHRILTPERVPFISYPYEWGFEQIKAAALLTLTVQQEALARGMSLKDASAFNVQFVGSRPVFIDTGSFEIDDQGPWAAYSQFCRHFLGPLLVMSHIDPAANRFLRVDLEGLSLAAISRVLPHRTWLNPDVAIHVHLHARFTKSGTARSNTYTKKPGLKARVAASLRSAIEQIRIRREETPWLRYQQKRDHYSDMALEEKRAVVSRLADSLRPRLVFDFGANDGEFSRRSILHGGYCVAIDGDVGCVDQHYRVLRSARDSAVLPLRMDLLNPSAGCGFHSTERDSLIDRGPADLVLALALLHHLRITGRVPLARIAEFLASLGRTILMEFVPVSDPMAKVLLGGMDAAHFEDYTPEGFLDAFSAFFDVSHCADLPGCDRSLWILRRNADGESRV